MGLMRGWRCDTLKDAHCCSLFITHYLHYCSRLYLWTYHADYVGHAIRCSGGAKCVLHVSHLKECGELDVTGSGEVHLLRIPFAFENLGFKIFCT